MWLQGHECAGLVVLLERLEREQEGEPGIPHARGRRVGSSAGFPFGHLENPFLNGFLVGLARHWGLQGM